MSDSALQRAKELPCWSGPVAPEPLGGGLSNTNFTVLDQGRRYVVRVGADAPEHAVWRFNELTVSRAAHLAGLSPEIRHHEADILVLDYIENARPLDDAAVRDPDMLPRVLEIVRRCHVDLTNHLEVPGPMFWVFNANRRYVRLLDEAGSRLGERLPGFVELNSALERAVGPIRPVFCHNDLLAANLIDDGTRLWLIDWEYGGWNSALFDLANMATNNAFGVEAEHRMLTLYYEAEPDLTLRHRYQAMKVASLLREVLWSLVAELRSALDIDYPAYTNENLDRLARARVDFESLDIPA